MNRLNITPLVKQILIACIVLFVGKLLLENKGIDLDQYLALSYVKNEDFKPWQLITHMFMHGNLTHILFNMIGLISFGAVLENFIGPKKFLTLFFVSGFGAVGLHILAQMVELYQLTGTMLPSFQDLNIQIEGEKIMYETTRFSSENSLQKTYGIMNSKTLGASGALYGIVAAFAYLFPNTQLQILFIPFPIKAKFLVPGFIALDLFLGISNFNWDPVAHFAHIGGALFGFLLIYYWRKFDRNSLY